MSRQSGPRGALRIPRWLLATCLAAAFCGGKSPAAPASIYAGEWSGSSLSFTVSSDQKISALSVTYDLNGCVGVDKFQDPGATFPAARTFIISLTLADARQLMIQVIFQSDTSAQVFLKYTGSASCGNLGTFGSTFFVTKH